MTYKEKKRYLEQYVYSKHRLIGLNNALEEWQAIATRTTQNLKQVMVANNMPGKRVEDCAIRLAKIEEKLLNEIEKNELCLQHVQDTIAGVKDTRRRELLELKYIYDLPVWKIAIEWNKSDRDIYYILRTTINSIKI